MVITASRHLRRRLCRSPNNLTACTGTRQPGMPHMYASSAGNTGSSRLDLSVNKPTWHLRRMSTASTSFQIHIAQTLHSQPRGSGDTSKLNASGECRPLCSGEDTSRSDNQPSPGNRAPSLLEADLQAVGLRSVAARGPRHPQQRQFRCSFSRFCLIGGAGLAVICWRVWLSVQVHSVRQLGPQSLASKRSLSHETIGKSLKNSFSLPAWIVSNQFISIIVS